MAKSESPTVEVKVVPDTSEFAAMLAQQLDLDDPMAKAIIAAPPDETRIIARVGDQCFVLHHWTVVKVEARRVLNVSWTPIDSDIVDARVNREPRRVQIHWRPTRLFSLIRPKPPVA
ncbi:hypothetical protein [Mycolicibacterium llatzerense]|uniref:hypothetical protein n=1 Tax=Mycolicibacterium llatzerense TaxID=280871 RepID=UPI0021B660F8|nr:hypothetical protein [Mycolicibacterium llatzerense]MCT7361306.1 hypothetical protein [Mycolicibacterium llatzerense]